MRSLITDLHYFPSVDLINALYQKMHVIFEQYENFQKMSFRNRCIIACAEGPITLSIPLVGGRDQKILMRDLKVDNLQNWQAQHWKTITSCYNRSPWFEHFKEELAQLFKTETSFLIDWNLKCFEWVMRVLKMNLSYELSQEYLKSTDGLELEDWRNRFRPNRRETTVETIRYHQVFEERTGFLPGLSVLDLIFCEGVNASKKFRN